MNEKDKETPETLPALTSREQEILKLLLDGVSPKEIAYNLNIGYKTVDVHRSNLYRKLGVHSIQELVVKYAPNQIKTDSVSLGEIGKELKPAENKPVKGRLLRIFVPVGIAIAAVALLVVGFFFIKPPKAAKDVSYFSDVDASPWVKWEHSKSTATLDYDVRNDICTITIGGIAAPDNRTRYYTQAQYHYAAEAKKAYTYVFEAWTQSGARSLDFVYYWDFADDMTLSIYDVDIDSTRKTYSITGKPLPKGGDRYLGFSCADQLGTFYVRILEIKE